MKREVFGTFGDLMKIVKKAKKVGYDQVELDDLGITIGQALEYGNVYGIKAHRGYDFDCHNGWYKNYHRDAYKRELKENAFRLVVSRNSDSFRKG